MIKEMENTEAENPLYHDTWMLLRKYRDVVWSLELSVQQVRRQFQIEFGSSIEDFLESIYLGRRGFCRYRYSGARPEHRTQLQNAQADGKRQSTCCGTSTSLVRPTTGSCTTPTFPHSSTKTPRKSLDSFSRISRISATAPISARKKKRLTPFLLFCGGILPRTA